MFRRDSIIEIMLAMVQAIMNPPKMEELGMMPKEGFSGILKIVLEGALTGLRDAKDEMCFTGSGFRRLRSH